MADPYLEAHRQRSAAIQMRRLQEQQAQFAYRQQALQAEQQRRAGMEQAQYQRSLSESEQRRQLAERGLGLREREGRERMRRDAQERARRELNDRRGALKPGYRWNAQDQMKQELVPGGPEETKLRAAHAEDLAKLAAINSGSQAIVGRMGSILRPSNKSWGFEPNFGWLPAYATRLLPGKPSDTRVELEQLEELSQAAGLGEIKGRSGQSIGAITEREWPKLASQYLKLSPMMSEKGAENMMNQGRRQVLNMRNKELEAYQNEWRGTPFYKENPLSVPPVHTEGKERGIPKTFAFGQEVWDSLTPEEKGLWMPGLK